MDPVTSRTTPPDELQSIVLPPTEQHTGTVVFLHGMGQYTQSWMPFIRTMAERLPHIKWILPQAPLQSVTMNDGEERPSWFDIFHLPPCNSCGVPGSSESIRRIEQIILSEIRTISQPKRVVVAGFSQGGTLGMLLSLTSLHDLGGVANLSGWIPRKSRTQMAQLAPDLPIFWGHGTADEEIPYDMAEECVGFLRHGLGIPDQRITFKAYNGLGHSVDNERETRDLAEWISVILN